MNKHEHVDCEHKVKYCKVCDVCYCEKCGREWPAYNSTWTYTVPNTQVWPNVSIYSTTCHSEHTT